MAKTPPKPPAKTTVPVEEVETLHERLKRTQAYYVAAFVFLLGCAGWFAAQVHYAQVSLAKLEDLPADVKEINKRTTAIEVELAGLKHLPDQTNKLNAAVTEARAELTAVGKSAADLSAAAAKMEELSNSVSALASKQAEQKKLADEIKASVAGITTRLQEQSERIADVKKQLSSAMPPPKPEAPEKRILVQFSLPEKPNGMDGGRANLVYESDFAVPAMASDGITRVEFIDFRTERDPQVLQTRDLQPSAPPITFAVEASLQKGEKSPRLRLVISTDKPQEFLEFYQKAKAVAVVAIFYR